MIRIHTFGGLSVRDGDGALLAGAAAQPRRMAILAVLARAGERGVARDKLLALLWPDADDERGSKTLAQALYALRRDLRAEDAVTGARELRFDPALVASDVAEFASAVSRGDDARAVALYEGPFLDGFHLAGAEEFSRWAERERAALVLDHARALESLARGTQGRGDPAGAVVWWRKLAALEPLNARVTVGLMDALVASGDRAGAVQHSRVYELLVQQELDLPPDREVMAYAERLRQQADASAASPPLIKAAAAPSILPTAETPPAAPAQHTADVPNDQTTRRRLWVAPRAATIAAVVVGVAIIALVMRGLGGRSSTRSLAGSQVVAVGRIASYGTDSSARAMAGPVSDLLATSLARAPGLRVVSPGRMLELMRNPAPGDTGAGSFDAAARRAGATEIIDGTLYLKPAHGLRLDLRRVDLSTGAIDGVLTIEGEDLFSLVDSGTARLVASLGSSAPVGSVADVMTHSVHAYRLYEEGIKAWFADDPQTALRLFDAAVAADSTFALATYYGAIASVVVSPDSLIPRIKRAEQLAARAPDRERLTILADWADRTSAPSMRQYAETLATRYPTEIEGHLYTGIALVLDGEFLQAVPSLQRVVSMDSLGARPQAMTCGLCAAMQYLISAYLLADSLPAAEREARRWVRLQPRAPAAVNNIVQALELEGRDAEADSLYRAGRPDLSFEDAISHHAAHLLRVGAYAEADSLFLIRARQGGRQTQMDALWTLALSQREQGRLADALATVRRTRPLARFILREDPPSTSILEAQIQLEAGRPAIAAALFDSVMWLPLPRHEETQVARHRAWMLTQVASAHAAAGDTGVLQRLADSVQAFGAASGYGRDRRLHHYVRGLLLAARRRDAEAIDEFRSSIYSTTWGYTRSNYELATLYLRGGRAREAVAILQPALRGDLQSQNLFVNRVEIHALLAKAWDAAGGRDSAAAHYRVVARAWAGGDPRFRVRADSARVRAP